MNYTDFTVTSLEWWFIYGNHPQMVARFNYFQEIELLYVIYIYIYTYICTFIYYVYIYILYCTHTYIYIYIMYVYIYIYISPLPQGLQNRGHVTSCKICRGYMCCKKTSRCSVRPRGHLLFCKGHVAIFLFLFVFWLKKKTHTHF